jgi:hypothetical protein
MLTLTLDRLGYGHYRVAITPLAMSEKDTPIDLSMFEAETLNEAMDGVRDRLIAYFRDCVQRAAPLTRAENNIDLF